MDAGAIFGVHRFMIHHWEESEIPPQLLPILDRWIANPTCPTDTERTACVAAAKVQTAGFLSIRSCLLLVRTIAASAVRPQEDAEEVVQDVMVKLTRSGWDHPFPEGLVRDVTRKTLRTFYRRRIRATRLPLDESAALDDLADTRADDTSMTTRLQISMSWRLLERWFESLVPGQRQIVERVFEGYSVTEISRELGIVDGVVSQRLYRARGHLKKNGVFAPLREALA